MDNPELDAGLTEGDPTPAIETPPESPAKPRRRGLSRGAATLYVVVLALVAIGAAVAAVKVWQSQRGADA